MPKINPLSLSQINNYVFFKSTQSFDLSFRQDALLLPPEKINFIFSALLKIDTWFFKPEAIEANIASLATLMVYKIEDIQRMTSNFRCFISNSDLQKMVSTERNVFAGLHDLHEPGSIKDLTKEELTKYINNTSEHTLLSIYLEESLSLMQLLQHACAQGMISFEPENDSRFIKAVIYGLKVIQNQFEHYIQEEQILATGTISNFQVP